MKLTAIQKHTKIARYAVSRAELDNHMQEEPLSYEDLKRKIDDYINGRQGWPEFKKYIEEGKKFFN